MGFVNPAHPCPARTPPNCTWDAMRDSGRSCPSHVASSSVVAPSPCLIVPGGSGAESRSLPRERKVASLPHVGVGTWEWEASSPARANLSSSLMGAAQAHAGSGARVQVRGYRCAGSGARVQVPLVSQRSPQRRHAAQPTVAPAVLPPACVCICTCTCTCVCVCACVCICTFCRWVTPPLAQLANRDAHGEGRESQPPLRGQSGAW